MPRLYDATGAVIGGECGVPDLYRGACAWPHRKITYHEAMAFRDMSREDIARAYDLAWKQWADVCGIEPARLPSASGANVAARAGRIGFRGGVLAWSQIPCGVSERAQMAQKYDTAERWSFNFLVAVACHECGHALGLSHLGRGTLMYRSITSITKPQAGDIAEAVARYGPPKAKPDPQPWPGPPSPYPPPRPPEPVEPEPNEPVPTMTDSAELARLLAPHRGGHVLAVDPRLEALARQIAEDNARRDTLDHRDGQGRWPHERAQAAGVTNYHGEVLAAGGPAGVKGLAPQLAGAFAAAGEITTAWPWLLSEAGMPEAGVPPLKGGAFDAWKQSAGHWRIITDPRAKSIGTGMVEVQGGAWKYFDGKCRWWAAVTGT